MIREEAETLLAARESEGGSTDRLLALRRMVSPLERMEQYLHGDVDADQFVIGFSREWAHLRIGRNHGPGVEGLRVEIQQFYELIHLFSPYPDVRSEEPMLFDERQLREHTRDAFSRLQVAWLAEATRS